jgi:ABC-2 type transport system ATP-binding protein
MDMPSYAVVPAERPVPGRPAVQSAVPESELAIATRGLAKTYRSPWTLRVTQALHPLDLDVRRGEVFGYLGPNGAGKTTTLKLLCGLLRPTRGQAWILGVPATEVRSRLRLGFLPEQPYFYDYLGGVEYLEMVGRLSRLDAKEAARRARAWLGRVGLGHCPALRLRKYSKGMLQRLGLAAALLHEPDVIVLDEPMSGLDPMGRRDVREIILEQRERGATVLFSSHILPDIETVCDRVAIILKGRLQRVVSVHELLNGGTQGVEIRLEGQPLMEFPPAWSDRVARCQRPDETVLTAADPAAAQEVLAWAVRSGCRVIAVSPQRSSLEDLFIATAEGAGLRAGDRGSRRSA